MQKDPVLIILAIIIVLIFFGIVVIVVLLYYSNKKKKIVKEKVMLETQFKEQLLQSQLEIQEYAFNQISEELHDNIGQLLSSTKLLLNISANELPIVPDTIKTAEQTVSKAIQDLRSLSKSFNNEWLSRFDLIENLKVEKERINAARNIEVDINTAYQKLPLESEAQVMIFRVVQEALQNSIRHALPKLISIQIKNTDDHLELNTQDDGKVFDINSAKKESLGLRNMEHRVQLLGGTINWQTAEDKGTLISIKIPASEKRCCDMELLLWI